jgi:hypothetical protein
MVNRVAFVLGAVVAAAASSVPAAACDRVLPTQLRILDCRLADATADALKVSPTLREQVAQIEALHGVVYVTTRFVVRPGTPHRLVGATANDVVRSGDLSITRVELTRSYEAGAIATLGHELHHVVEILSGANAHEYYAGSSATFETDAAQDVERSVLRELRAARTHR